MNRCRKENAPLVPNNMIDVARIVAEAVARRAEVSKPPRGIGASATHL